MSDERPGPQDLAERVRALSAERRELLDRLLAEEGLVGREAPILPRPSGHDRAPASFAQERLWLQKRIEPDNPAYTIVVAVRLDGPLSVRALEQAFGTLVLRHEVLRTRFEPGDGSPVQVIQPPPAHFRLPVEAIAEGGEAEVHARVVEETRRPFDPAVAPLWRATLLRTDAEAHVVLITLDHLLADEWAVGVLIRELLEVYRARLQGEEPGLPRLPVQYADYSAWQRSWMGRDLLDAQLFFWRRHLEPVPPPLRFGDESRPFGDARGGRHTATFDPALAGDLRALATRRGVTLFVLLLAAYESLIAWTFGQDRFTVGTDLACRDRPEVEPLIGFFANQVALRADLGGVLRFGDHLDRVREAVLGALAYQGLPFQHVVDALEPRRSARPGSPLFRTKLVLQEPRPELPDPEELGGLRLTPFEVDVGAYKFDLLVNLRPDGDRIAATVEYASHLFDPRSISWLVADFETVLRRVVERPDATLEELARRLDEARVRRREEEGRAISSRGRHALRSARRRGAGGSGPGGG